MKRMWLSTLVLSGGLIVLLDLIYQHHAHAAFWWHLTPAFDLLYGFVGCVGMVLITKWLGHAGLQRDENFYEDNQA